MLAKNVARVRFTRHNPVHTIIAVWLQRNVAGSQLVVTGVINPTSINGRELTTTTTGDVVNVIIKRFLG